MGPSLQKGSMVMAEGKATAEGIMAEGKGMSRWKGRERDGGGTEGKREVSHQQRHGRAEKGNGTEATTAESNVVEGK